MIIQSLAIDDYALIDTAHDRYVCRVCREPMRPVYDNVGYQEQPSWEVSGYEACTHCKDTEEDSEA